MAGRKIRWKACFSAIGAYDTMVLYYGAIQHFFGNKYDVSVRNFAECRYVTNSKYEKKRIFVFFSVLRGSFTFLEKRGKIIFLSHSGQMVGLSSSSILAVKPSQIIAIHKERY